MGSSRSPAWLAGAALIAACSSYTGTDPVVDGPDASASSSSSGGAGTDAGGTPEAGGSSSSSSAGGVALKPGEIFCAKTQTVCNVQAASCCINISGTDSAAVRSYGNSSAACGDTKGTNCGAYVSIGDDFNMKFPQRCAQASDCPADRVCCVVSGEVNNRFSKQLASIDCTTTADCNTRGRILCKDRSQCAPSENCTAETDPVLSHVYDTFCH